MERQYEDWGHPMTDHAHDTATPDVPARGAADGDDTNRERTAAAMCATAEALEQAEAGLHRSARQSPDEEHAARLHQLGDEVTAQARDIARRADRLTE